MQFDVLIVGASFAGLAAARTAASRGLSVAVIEAKRDAGARVHTSGILVREAIDEMQLGGTGKQIVLEADGDLRGEWEEDRIARVVHNLLSNALKYSRGIVRLRLAAEDGDVVLDVANDAPPIPESSLSAIFEPLWTSDPKAGLGLGLFIVREIVSAHQGTVSVRSSESEGTTFTVRLPRRASTK